MNFYIENLDHPVSHGTDYPGLRFDTTDDKTAVALYLAAHPTANGDRLRVCPGSSMTWFTVAAQPPQVGQPAPAAALPAAG